VRCFSNTLGWYADVPGEPIVAERGAELQGGQQGHDLHTTLAVGERLTVGYRERRGGGSIVCLGLVPSPEVIVALHGWLGVPIASRVRSGSVSSALFRSRDGTRFLIAVNNGDEDRAVNVAVDASASRATDLFTGGSWSVTGVLEVMLSRKSGAALRLD
jgi:hypothetical protein